MNATIFPVSRIVTCLFALAFSALPAIAQTNLASTRLGAQVEAIPGNPSASISETALISGHSNVGYALPNGRTDLVLSLSKIENIDIVSFLNNGATGTVTVATSNSKLAAASLQWHQIAKQDLAAKVTKIKLGPTEAKYIRFTFNIAKAGRIADLGVYPISTLTIANMNLVGGAQGGTDGKDVKDFGGGKEAKEVAEGPPAEGPPPNLPDPPPFVFVPLVSQ